MANPKNIDLSEDRLVSLGFGLIFRLVCAPSSWSPERVSDQASADDPPGTSLNRWAVSEPREREDEFNGVNHLPCPDCADRTHWLINC